jgi:methylmalonyl-CoA mutase N-terminal domain/subunit
MIEEKNAISAKKTAWEEGPLKKALERAPERKARFETSSGREVPRLAIPEDLKDLDYMKDLGFPGEIPFTRGVQPSMYRGRFWTMRQYAGFASARETNERFKYLLSQGQTGLSVAFDLPTQMGYDSDDPVALGEVGKVGVPVDSLADMETLFDGIPLQKVSTSMTINAPACVLLAMYAAVAEKQGADLSKLDGTVQNDILKEYIARGTYIFPPAPSMRLTVDLIEYTSRHLPRWNPISVSGYHIREAGSTAAQELAFTLADGMAYVEAVLARGLDIDLFAPRISFFFNAHNNLLEEVAKFRAARRMWSRMMREAGAGNPRSMALRFHTQTAGCTLTAQQPLNNIVRVAMQALAAVLGGTQSLHTNSYDEALCLPTEEAVRIALRTQQILAHESGVCDTVDPLGGSYYLESLTAGLESQAGEYLQRIRDWGGVLRAIEEGHIQREIQNSAYAFQKKVEKGEDTVVGVNDFQVGGDERSPVRPVDPAEEEAQKKRLAALRGKRDHGAVKAILEELRVAASGDQNLMEPVMKAVKAYATLGEICGVMRKVFGEYQESVTL